MNVAITGSNGLVGGAIVEQLDPSIFTAIPIDLPEVDARDYGAFLAATVGGEALIHLAWKDLIPNVLSNTSDPDNLAMARNAYKVAAASGINRVIVGSSNQAHGYEIIDDDGRIRPATRPDKPTNLYGHEKLAIEDMGRKYAKESGIEVISLRIGNVNAEDKPKPTIDGRPQRWLSKRDLGSLVAACLLAENVTNNFQIVYGVSDGSVFDWINPFGYRPLDKA